MPDNRLLKCNRFDGVSSMKKKNCTVRVRKRVTLMYILCMYVLPTCRDLAIVSSTIGALNPEPLT